MVLKHQALQQWLHREAPEQGQSFLNNPQPLLPCPGSCFAQCAVQPCV